MLLAASSALQCVVVVHVQSVSTIRDCEKTVSSLHDQKSGDAPRSRSNELRQRRTGLCFSGERLLSRKDLAHVVLITRRHRDDGRRGELHVDKLPLFSGRAVFCLYDNIFRRLKPRHGLSTLYGRRCIMLSVPAHAPGSSLCMRHIVAHPRALPWNIRYWFSCYLHHWRAISDCYRLL